MTRHFGPEAGDLSGDLLVGARGGVVVATKHRRPTKEVVSPWKQEPDRRPPLTLGQAAEYLNVTERYMRRLVAERRIGYFKVGRLLRFSAGDLDALLEAGRVEPPEPHPLLSESRPRRAR